MKRSNSGMLRAAIAAMCVTMAGRVAAQVPVGPPGGHVVALEAVKAAHAQRAGISNLDTAMNTAMLDELIRIDARLAELLALEREKSEPKRVSPLQHEQ